MTTGNIDREMVDVAMGGIVAAITGFFAAVALAALGYTDAADAVIAATFIVAVLVVVGAAVVLVIHDVIHS